MSTRADRVADLIKALIEATDLDGLITGAALDHWANAFVTTAMPTAYASIKDVADLTGRAKETLTSWVRRGQHDCPQPLGVTAAGQIWDRQDWVDWVALHPGLVSRTYPGRPVRVRDAPQA